MALTQISTDGIKNGTITGSDLATNIDLVDNQRLRLGNGQDLQIYHDGSTNNSHIKELGSGCLVLNTDCFRVKNAAHTENLIAADINSSVQLFFDNSKKFETTSGGVLTTGNTSTTGAFVSTQTGGGVLSDNLSLVDDKKVKLGASDDLQIFHDGTHSRIKNSTGDLFINSDTVIRLQSFTGPETMAKFFQNGAAELYHDNDKKFETISTGANVTSANDAVLRITTTGTASTDDARIELITQESTFTIQNDRSLGTDGVLTISAGSEAGIYVFKDGVVQLYNDGSKKLETTSTGATITGTLAATNTNITTQMFMPDQGQIRLGNSDDLKLYHDGHSVIQNTHSSAAFLISSHATHIVNAALTENIAKFIENGSVELYHNNSKQFETTSTGTTTFGTHHSTSDIALKTNIKPITNTLEKIQQITGYKYKFIKSNENSIGVVAQEVEKVFPELVDGTEGNKTLQYNGLIGVLIEAVKELSAEVAALKAS